MLRSVLSSWLLSSSNVVARSFTTRSPIESVPPPSEDRSWPSRLGDWLMASGWRVAAAGSSSSGRRRGEAIADARLDFADALFDIRTDAAADTLDRIAETDRLHELWHLRAEVFGRVAKRHGQAEAERRLTEPTRKKRGRRHEPEHSKQYSLVGAAVEREIPVGLKDDKRSIVAARRIVSQRTHLEFDAVAKYHQRYRRSAPGTAIHQ